MENTQSETNFMSKESINEAILNSTQQFLEITEMKMRNESETIDVNNRKDSIIRDEDTNANDKSDFYNNIYWKTDIKEVDFEIS